MTGAEQELSARLNPPDRISTTSSSSTMASGSGNQVWSSRAAKTTYKEMSFTLQPVGEAVPSPLTRKEIAQLLVHKLRIPPEQILGVDNSYWKNIKVRLPPTVNVDEYLNECQCNRFETWFEI